MSGGAADRAAIVGQLERVLASRDFDASERNRRFLGFVVTAALEGRAEQIKAYTIGTEVFGRDAAFDPQTDPIVRIEARRLRRSLEHYYLTAGRSDEIVISIPRGSYAPLFAVAGRGTGLLVDRDARPEGGPAGSEGRSARGPALFVMPFEDDDDFAPVPSLSRGLTREIISRLTRFEGLRVFGPTLGGLPPSDIPALPPDVDYVLSGGIGRTGEGIQVTASLIAARSQRYLWSDRFQAPLDPREFHAIRDEVADRVVEALASPYGVVFTDQVREMQGRPPESFSSYETILLYYEYWKRCTPDLFELVRGRLEKTVAAEPSYAEALAALASVYADAYRFNFPHELEFDLLDRSLELARRAVELAPLSGAGYRALHHALWFKGEVAASLDAAERALRLNPNNTDVMADLGMRLAFTGQWERGVALVATSYERNPGQASHYRIALVFDHCMHRRYVEALREAERTYFPDLLPYHLMLALVHACLGRADEAATAVAEIVALDPGFPAQARTWLSRRNICRELADFIVAGLQLAGMQIPDAEAPSEQEDALSLIARRRERLRTGDGAGRETRPAPPARARGR
jgi:adenylate cyclase